MMHTEDEAKAKWCPFGRMSVTDEPASNRWGNGSDQETKCIGSACMAWRAIMACETVIGERDKKPEGDGWEWDTFSDDRWERPVPTGKGYCGLAGRPA